MTKQLRKWHFRVWSTIAILLPVGILLSWLVIPNPVPVKPISASRTMQLPDIVASRESLQYCLNLRSSKDRSSWQIEWKNKLPLTTPSALIYLMPDSGNNKTTATFNTGSAELIGRIEAQGDYIFEIPGGIRTANELTFVVYDFIHERIIETIVLASSRTPEKTSEQKL